MIEILTADALAFKPADFAGCDVLIVDPPYSDHVHANMASHGTNGRGSRPRDPGFEALTPELRKHVAELAQAMRRWSVVFSDFEESFMWRNAVTHNGLAETEYIRLVPWVRWSQPQLSGDRPPTGAEAVLHFHATGAKHWNGPGSLTHYARRCLRGDGKHPTEKPIDLLLDLVSWFSDPGETVLDVCGGAGTTALACALLDRDALVLERDPQWEPVAKRRASLGAWLDRDLARVGEWCETTIAEARSVPAPKAADGSDRKTWERAQRRLADVDRVLAKVA